jgi:hypothetical protein
MYDKVVELLITYWQETGPADQRMRNRCRQVAERVIRYLPAGVSKEIRTNPQTHVGEIRDALIHLIQKGDPGTRKLIQSLVETEQRSTRQQSSVTGQGHQVVVVGGNVGGDIIVVGQPTSDQRPNGVSERIVSDHTHLARLHKVLDAHFNEEELRTLCFDLNVDYDNLPAQGKVNKARELIAYLDRHGRIPELLRMGEQLRPDISWSDTH